VAKKKTGKAVSIWATPKDYVLFKSTSKLAGKPLSEIVRVLVNGYAQGKLKPDGLPKIGKRKPKKKAKAKKPSASVEVIPVPGANTAP
jgi:hypothetical protein